MREKIKILYKYIKDGKPPLFTYVTIFSIEYGFAVRLYPLSSGVNVQMAT